MKPIYSVVVPLYNEEEVIREAYRRLTEVMESVDGSYELVFVNDGSRDATQSLARAICEEDKRVRLISFSRNFGHQTAITAGMEHALGQAVVVIDADLQDPPGVIPRMIEKWKEGYGVIYGLRTKRKGETLFKKLTASVFYRFLRHMTDVDVPADAGDFRLLDRKVVDALLLLPERNRYVRGLVSWVGFRQTGIPYVREERFAGKTKYPLKKMLRFAGDAIVSFSTKPLKWLRALGAAVTLGGAGYLVALLVRALGGGIEQGETKLMLGIVLFVLGVFMTSLGITLSYVGRILDEARGRPLYIVEEEINAP